MLHLFMDKKPWFRAKSYGLGTGRPIAWQGWVFLTLHLTLVAGVALLGRIGPLHITAGLVLLAVILPWPIYRKRTEGGWHWRWGGNR